MRAILPSLLLLTSCAARAGGAEPRPAVEQAAEEAAEAPRPPEGSLWDRIEGGSPGDTGTALDQEAERASAELAEERGEELAFLDAESDATLLDALAWYKDPLGFLTRDPLVLQKVDPAEFDLPLVTNAAVQRWMRYYLGRGRKYYARWLARSGRYRDLISSELEAHDLPRDLFYLAMVESGFSTRAYSRASAVGLWQFIASTGRAYDLRVDWWIDERRDPVRATRAAVAHLEDLYGIFGDWPLAAAAYNCGAGRVRRALKASDARDYWGLCHDGALPPETCSYYPKILAAAIIGHHPERYGFGEVELQPPLEWEDARAPGSTSLAAMARCAGLDEAAFKELNPALRRWALPPEPDHWTVHVPPGTAESFTQCVEQLPPSERLAFQRHRVRRGETLSSIARRYGVSVDAICRMNHLRDPNRLVAGSVLVIPVPGSSAASAAPAAEEPPTVHVVRRGETLASIASRYGTTPQALAELNGLEHPDRILVGQKLLVRGAPPRAQATTYTVRRGDTLSSIARRFGVSAADIARWNRISDPSRIRAGQVLTLYVPADAWTYYSVHKGDTLSSIARRYHCTVADVKAWNGLTSSTIYPGQVLKLRRP